MIMYIHVHIYRCVNVMYTAEYMHCGTQKRQALSTFAPWWRIIIIYEASYLYVHILDYYFAYL